MERSDNTFSGTINECLHLGSLHKLSTGLSNSVEQIKSYAMLELELFLKKLLLSLGEEGTIRWNQYTPSFNDGEPCVFQYEMELAIKIDQLKTPISKMFENLDSKDIYDYYAEFQRIAKPKLLLWASNDDRISNDNIEENTLYFNIYGFEKGLGNYSLSDLLKLATGAANLKCEYSLKNGLHTEEYDPGY